MRTLLSLLRRYRPSKLAMKLPHAGQLLCRALVWAIMIIAWFMSFMFLYGQFRPATPTNLNHSLNVTAMMSAGTFALLIAWCVGVLLTGINAIFIPSNRHGSALIPVDPAPDHDGPQRFTLARCPHCDYERRGLAIDAPCPECGEPPPRVHTLPGRGQAMALYGTCTHCGRALRKKARCCAGCRYPVPRAGNRPGKTPPTPGSPK